MAGSMQVKLLVRKPDPGLAINQTFHTPEMIKID